MTFTCELSGETSLTGMVVTPSGHVCSERLLNQRLAENGGVDPFSQGSTPLSTDDCVTLVSNGKTLPRTGTSMPQLLESMQQEYDAVLLELIETRQALQETRQELSQALYQNDAALRVVARLALERDAAREEVPLKKKQRTLTADIPAQDLQEMKTVWESLHQTRKARQKQAAATAPKNVGEFAATKSLPSGGSAIARCGDHVVVANEKQWVLYQNDKVLAQKSVSDKICSIDMSEATILVGCADGTVQSFAKSGDAQGSFSVDSAAVDVRLHPDEKHLVVASDKVTLARLDRMVPVAVFGDSAQEITCGCLHPDGLIYVAGTAAGELQLWDFNSQGLAATLADGSGPVSAVTVSNNGYHVVAAHASDNNVRVWDIRKQKQLANLELNGANSVSVDPSGTYIAYGSTEGVKIVTVKAWKTVTASFEIAGVEGLAWGDTWLAASAPEEVKVFASE